MQSPPHHARCTAIFAFDVLHIDANDHRGLPLVVREAALNAACKKNRGRPGLFPNSERFNAGNRPVD